MANLKVNTTPYITDIRQSDAWMNYLQTYGWYPLKLSKGATIHTIKLAFFNKANLLRPNSLNEEDLQEIADICKKHKILTIKISPNQNQDMVILKSQGYKKTKNLTLAPKTAIINLEDNLKKVWNNLTSGCRYSINKSKREKDRLEFKQEPSQKDINAYHSLIKDRGRKKGFYVQDLKDHTAKIKAFGKEAYIGNVYDTQGHILGTKLFLGFKKCIWGMYAATTPIGQKSCGGYNLLWEALEYFKNQGYEQLDLDGLFDSRAKKSSTNRAGYTFFKKQFNGKILTFPMPHTKTFNIFT